MKFYKITLIVCVLLGCSSVLFGQKNVPAQQNKTNAIKSSPAYAELLLRKVELESDIESLLISYTEDFPKIKEAKFELALLQKSLAKLFAQTDATILTLALGKLMVKKVQIETDLWTLQNRFGDEYPDVKRTKRKVLTYQNAIKEIMP